MTISKLHDLCIQNGWAVSARRGAVTYYRKGELKAWINHEAEIFSANLWLLGSAS